MVAIFAASFIVYTQKVKEISVYDLSGLKVRPSGWTTSVRTDVLPESHVVGKVPSGSSFGP